MMRAPAQTRRTVTVRRGVRHSAVPAVAAALKRRDLAPRRFRFADPRVLKAVGESDVVSSWELPEDPVRDRNWLEARPGSLQQTLWRSFTVGGTGLHSGELSYVRVRPAFAGDGRYFVRVPLGTNKDKALPLFSERVILPEPPEEDVDEEAELFQSEQFLNYLDYKEKEGYIGDFETFLEENGNLEAYELLKLKEIRQEEPVEKGDPRSIIPATLSSLVEKEALYETTLQNARGDRVQSVEHLLAALEASGVDNARIEIEGGPEVPALDGSSAEWIVDVEQVGVTFAQCGDGTDEFYARAAMKPDAVVHVQEGDAFITLIPGDKMQLTYGIDHSKECPMIGMQWASWCLQDTRNFGRAFAAAKPYVALEEDLTEMRLQGFMKGSSDFTLLRPKGDEWYALEMVTYPADEPVRHKILDLLGDLALMAEEGMSGLPFGHIIAYKANHALHHKFAKKLLETHRQRYMPFMAESPEEDVTEEEEMDATELLDDVEFEDVFEQENEE